MLLLLPTMTTTTTSVTTTTRQILQLVFPQPTLVILLPRMTTPSNTSTTLRCEKLNLHTVQVAVPLTPLSKWNYFQTASFTLASRDNYQNVPPLTGCFHFRSFRLCYDAASYKTYFVFFGQYLNNSGLCYCEAYIKCSIKRFVTATAVVKALLDFIVKAKQKHFLYFSVAENQPLQFVKWN